MSARTWTARTVAALAALSLPGSAQAQQHPTWVDFQLYTGCAPVGLRVILGEDVDEIGLTRPHIETAVRSRLRGARIYAPAAVSPDSILGIDVATSEAVFSVSVAVAGRAFDIGVRLLKPVRDEHSGIVALASTWSTGAYGTHGGDSGYVFQVLARLMDEFIDEYLAANERACG